MPGAVDRRRARFAAVAGALLVAAIVGIEEARGQEARGAATEGTSVLPQGSSYLPLGHWAYDYIDMLVARGRIDGLAPLVRPYRRIDIARAIRAAEDEGQLSVEELEWVAALEPELRREMELLAGDRPEGVAFWGELGAGLKALTHTHRDPLRPAGDESLFPTLLLGLYGDAPGGAAALRVRWDNHLLNDPQFPGGRAIEFRECDPLIDECAYRPEEAYVEIQMPYVRLFFGRVYRNWGLPGTFGMLVSPYAYSYDHIAYRFGTERVALSGLYAPFDDFGGDTARHFSSHRFDWRILDNLAISVGESAVYGGPNRRIDFRLTNPILPWEIAGSREGTERNSMGTAEVWWRIYDDLVTYGAFLVDNTAVGDDERTEGFNQYAAAVGVQLPTLAPRFALRADLSLVSALAYRSRVARYEYYAVDGIGLAHDRTDAAVVSLRGDWFPRAGLILVPRLDLMWKGEDDITDDWPDEAFTGRDLLLVGTIERTVRASLGGRYHVRGGELRWDLGLNLVKNRGHSERGWRAIGVGRVELDLRARLW